MTRPSPRLQRHVSRIARVLFGHSRVVLTVVRGVTARDNPDRAELWTWFRAERRWELAIAARGTSPDAALEALVDEMIAF
jgi:hypothetical protein